MQLLRGDAPAAAARGNTAPQPGTAAPAAAGSCRAQLRDKAAQVACGSPSSLPVPFATAQEPGSPSEPPGKHQRLAAELNGRRAGRLLSAGKLERLIEELQKELLAVLQQQGPTTEGIFCKVESARALQELRQALDHGLHVDMASQPVLLLAMVLKDFLRSIPGKLLVTDLYEDWMAAMQMASREDKISQLKAAMPGRAKWACRQSRQGAPGKKLSSCISLTDRRPPRRWRRDHGSGGPKRQRYVSFTNPSTTRPGQVGRRARRQAGAKGKKDKSQARASEQAGAKAKAQDPKGPQTQKSPKPKSKPPKSPPLKKQVSENLKPKSPPKRQKHRLQYPPNL
ncbi:uncharacterized protein LOC104693200 isoform X2 [Corvus cornix cornix]|uniref:uncharacterized protein LOC104693200 isoform X2 n=1 Tax=Corvus cornix cornix TaxID=932674 RepID=UPI0019512055|nr:uncharacterized protein LOC104693200 isoform X2 [Corvus cornix cornix]